MTSQLNRRSFARRIAAVSSAGLLAGCGGSGDESSSGESGGSAQTTPARSEVSEYLGNSANFDGNLTVKSSSDAVSVKVGAEGNGGAYAYAPVAIEISSGTTVSWEWTGKGSTHNVVSQGDGPLDSGSPVAEASTTYEHTFEDSGTYLYYCTPHKSMGMKGAVVVK
ncbi:halocyanin domain-containing protein [Haloarcula nitratireducens]|uniref:Halocyanin domain-containing protein n=1 Tax=Haloarcula nitratireducens TaxID=2487749 RepID=A0AAW4PIX3_9EURY|nr:halocyanin domain-containing protein [Halomicroarcula nitratireducens]MBX0297431.1 halocyanin domain-containing protein [Halomicroarcula nitratireducens]